VPRQHDPLPRGEVGVDLAPRLGDLRLDLADLLLEADPDAVGLGMLLQLLELALQFVLETAGLPATV